MSDNAATELRELAHAIEALAESNLGIGQVMRDSLYQQRAQSQTLAQICEQQSQILDEIKHMNARHEQSDQKHAQSGGRHLDSESKIQILRADLNSFGVRLEQVEKNQIGRDG
jgi:hypothetical protein